MKATLFRTIPMALAVLVVAVVAATAALAVSGETPALDAAAPVDLVSGDDPVAARPSEEDHDLGRRHAQDGSGSAEPHRRR